jgi:N6-adenosine-specific RNA methylase IME4
MTLEDICGLPIDDVVTDDALLFLWSSPPMLEKATRVLEAWGFQYKTMAVWDKLTIGMGYFFRQQHELLLVGERGNMPKPSPENRPPSVIQETRGKHSEKPAAFYEIIEAMYPELLKLELFSRRRREGWISWGNQAGENEPV